MYNEAHIFKVYNLLRFTFVYTYEQHCQINAGYSVKFKFQINNESFFYSKYVPNIA